MVGDSMGNYDDTVNLACAGAKTPARRASEWAGRRRKLMAVQCDPTMLPERGEKPVRGPPCRQLDDPSGLKIFAGTSERARAAEQCTCLGGGRAARNRPGSSPAPAGSGTGAAGAALPPWRPATGARDVGASEGGRALHLFARRPGRAPPTR
jgi:hypothetical protein